MNAGKPLLRQTRHAPTTMALRPAIEPDRPAAPFAFGSLEQKTHA
jgi:hypothetical protein